MCTQDVLKELDERFPRDVMKVFTAMSVFDFSGGQWGKLTSNMLLLVISRSFLTYLLTHYLWLQTRTHETMTLRSAWRLWGYCKDSLERRKRSVNRQDIREGHKVQASWKNGAKKEVLKGKVVGYEDDGDGEVKLKIKWNKDRTTTSHGLDMDGLESLETMEVPALVDCEYHLVVFIKLLVGGAEVVRACCLCCRHKH